MATSQSNNYGLALGTIRRLPEAIAAHEKAIRVIRSTLGDAHLETAATLSAAALTFGKAGRRQEARAFAQESLGIERRAFGDKHPRTSLALKLVARLNK